MEWNEMKLALARLELPLGASVGSAATDRAGVAAKALPWLVERHEQAVAAAIDKMLFGGLEDAEQAALKGLDAALWRTIAANAAEWLLAEGEIRIDGAAQRVADLLLAPAGPAFTASERIWLERLARQPLRMYAVVEVVPGQQIVLRDALDAAAAPFAVDAAAASRVLAAGDLAALRVSRAEAAGEMSWACYRFDGQTGAGIVAQLREGEERLGDTGMDLAGIASLLIRLCWLVQHFKPLSRAPASVPQTLACTCGDRDCKDKT